MKRDLYNDRQLWLPLVVSIFGEPVSRSRLSNGWNNLEEYEADYWSDEDMIRCHGYLLEQSIKDLLDSRTGLDTKLEIIEWLQAITKPLKAFSFRTCCELFGYDSDDVRSAVLGRFEQKSNFH